MSVLIELRPESGPVLVVGGGAIALRKARTLVDGGFAVTVVSPVITADLQSIAARCTEREFEDRDISEQRWALVLACTDDRDVNQRVGSSAREKGIPVLVADAQDESTFFSPAVFRDGALQVAVSTGGADPSLAKTIRERIVGALGTGWGERIAAARRTRQDRLGRAGDDE